MMVVNEMLGHPAFVTSYWDVVLEELREILEMDSGIDPPAEVNTSIMLAMRPDLVWQSFIELIDQDLLDPSNLREADVYPFRTNRDRDKYWSYRKCRIGNLGER